jgi:hypothetical protein
MARPGCAAEGAGARSVSLDRSEAAEAQLQLTVPCCQPRSAAPNGSADREQPPRAYLLLLAILTEGKASALLLQRRMAIGYVGPSRILDRL